MDWWESHEPNCNISHFDRGTGRAAFAVSTDEVKSARPVTGKPNQKVVKNLCKYLDERFFIFKSERLYGLVGITRAKL